MIIAQEKKKNNIAEYVLYMWQLEDIIRANGFDMARMEETIISQFQEPEEMLAEIRHWYANLIDMMASEGVKEKGHLQININTIFDLTDLHARLLTNAEQAAYQQMFTRLYPVLEEFRMRSKAGNISDIEVAFNALYSYWLLKLQKHKLTKETHDAMKSFSELVASLARAYHQRERGEIDI